MSFSAWKCPAMMREPLRNVSVPRCAENSCGSALNELRNDDVQCGKNRPEVRRVARKDAVES